MGVPITERRRFTRASNLAVAGHKDIPQWDQRESPIGLSWFTKGVHGASPTGARYVGYPAKSKLARCPVPLPMQAAMTAGRQRELL
jgi:hypothetical protein